MKNRVAYLSLTPVIEGSAEYTHVHEVIKGLRRRGWRVDHFTPATGSAGGSVFGRFAAMLASQWKLLRQKPLADCVYMRFHFAAFFTALCCKLLRLPLVVEVNGPYADLYIAWPAARKLSLVFTWMMRSQLRWADAVITVTEDLATWVKSEKGRRRENTVFVVPNGADVDLFSPVRRSDSPIISGPYVVSFGTFAPWQGVPTMLEAVTLPEWPVDVRLVFAGDGVDRAKIEETARCSGRVVFLGRLPQLALAALIAGSLGGLSPQSNIKGRSKTGLCPLKVFETLACGVPVIVTDFPGQADLVRTNACGFVIPPDNPVALAKAVAAWWGEPMQRLEMGKAGREIVLQSYSWDHQAGETEKVLRSIPSMQQ